MKKKTKKTQSRLHTRKLVIQRPGVRKIIDDRRKELKLTVYALAKLSGVSDQTTRKFLDGTYTVRVDKLEAFMRALGLEITVSTESNEVVVRR